MSPNPEKADLTSKATAVLALVAAIAGVTTQFAEGRPLSIIVDLVALILAIIYATLWARRYQRDHRHASSRRRMAGIVAICLLPAFLISVGAVNAFPASRSWFAHDLIGFTKPENLVPSFSIETSDTEYILNVPVTNNSSGAIVIETINLRIFVQNQEVACVAGPYEYEVSDRLRIAKGGVTGSIQDKSILKGAPKLRVTGSMHETCDTQLLSLKFSPNIPIEGETTARILISLPFHFIVVFGTLTPPSGSDKPSVEPPLTTATNTKGFNALTTDYMLVRIDGTTSSPDVMISSCSELDGDQTNSNVNHCETL